MNEIKPYKLSISNDEIEDLKRRLANTRLPDQAPGEPWKTGTDLEWFKKLLAVSYTHLTLPTILRV